MWKRPLCSTLLALALAALIGTAVAAEAPKKADAPKKEEPKKAEPKKEALAGDQGDVVAKVDDAVIRRADLIEERRQLAINNPRRPVPNNELILDRLINRVLLQRYITQERLAPSGGEVQAAIQRIDAQLRRRGSSYQKFLDDRGLTAESHAARIRYEISMRRLIERIAKGVTEEQVRAEFDAHPEFYDGSRIRISQIFVDTSNIGQDPKKMAAAKEKIDKCYADLKAGKEFKSVASDRSEGPAAARGGDRGWFVRKASEADEVLLAAAWKLKVGEFTAPIRGSRGWHILTVTEREPAWLTYFGAKRKVKQALTRQKLEAILDGLKKKAKIEKLL